MNEITDRHITDWLHDTAWKRSGFKDKEALFDAVRELPLEEKVNMLTEICMDDMAKMLLKRKQEFLLSLGHKTWVDGDEGFEYACRIYNDGSWRIDKAYFQPYMIEVDGLYCNMINGPHVGDLQKKRKGNKK